MRRLGRRPQARTLVPRLIAVFALALAPAAARGGEDDAWPANGPTREGPTLVFPTTGVRWTMPEGSPFAWTSPTSQESRPKGVLVRVKVAADPDAAQIHLRVDPSEQPLRVDLPLPDFWLKDLGKELTDLDPKRTEARKAAPMGNATCHHVRKAGTWNGKPGLYRGWLTYRNGRILAIEAWMRAPAAGERSLDPALDALVATFAFDGTKPWVVGPAHVAGTLTSDHREPVDADREVELPFLGRTIKKPIGLSTLDFDPGRASPTLKALWEAWGPDRTTYFCAILEAIPDENLKGDYAEGILKEHETWWRKNVEDAEIVTKGKHIGTRVPFGKAKGNGYEFRGRFAGSPFVEKGFFGTHKGIVYMLHFQFGGEGAEEALGPLREKVRAALGL